MSDIVAAQFKYPGHPYKAMADEGLAHLWVGRGRNDFHPGLIKAVCKHLEKHKLPHERGDAINAIRNRILQADWGWLEQRFDEHLETTKTAMPELQPTPPDQPKLVCEMSLEEQQAAREAIERARPRRSLKKGAANG